MGVIEALGPAAQSSALIFGCLTAHIEVKHPKEHQDFRQRRYLGSSGRTSHPPRDPVFRARLCAPEKCVTAVRSGSPGGGSLSLRYRWAQQARCAIRRPSSPCLRSRIPRPCAHRSRWRRLRVPSRARLRGGWGAFLPGGGKFPPHPPSVTPEEPHPLRHGRPQPSAPADRPPLDAQVVDWKEPTTVWRG